jgi:hypothetical protein
MNEWVGWSTTHLFIVFSNSFMVSVNFEIGKYFIL